MVTVRFLLESCIEIGLSAMICILMIDGKTFEGAWESISTIFAFASLAALLIAPFILYRLTKRYLEDKRQAKIDNSHPVHNEKLFASYRVN